MDDELMNYTQQNYIKSDKLSIEQDKFTESAIPPNSTETNNSNVFGSSFEDLLAATNPNKGKEKKEKNSDKKKENKEKIYNSLKNQRQIPKSKIKQLQKENNKDKEEESEEEGSEEESEEESEEIEEEEEEEEEEESEKKKKNKKEKGEKIIYIEPEKEILEEEKEKEKENENEKEKENGKEEKIKKEKEVKPKAKKKLSNLEIVNQDENLKPFELNIKQRILSYKKNLNEIVKNEKSLENFSKSYEFMGINLLSNGDIKYREYAPGAKGISLFGEFNNWNKEQYWATKDKFGYWELIIPNENGSPKIQHGQIVKVNVVLEDGNWMERNPIWSHYLIQNKESMILENIFWNPEIKYKWKYPKKHMKKPKSLRIYEVHIGLSSFDPKINTYKEFAQDILPRVKKMGYTAIQFMAIMEHANYASFGFHVNYLFAISSRFGTPEEFMYLIDKCHENGLYVIMDIIHSHASSNVNDGFNYWDGTDHLYFHGGELGKHIQFDSRLYNYSSYETLRLLLSNCAYYINEYRIDGFRFDCVTSMLYTHHGIDYNFTGDYKLYFSEYFNEESSVYLMLANTLIHKINPEAITIAEDFSGIPGLSRPVEEGGFGFDYNVNMKMCDKWKEFLMNLKDEEWNMGNIIYNLTKRRYNEKQISYCESHDQSFLGNYSLSSLLFSGERFWNMSKKSPETIVIYRGICLHKMIRLLNFALGGEGYLSFMGNEFACPDSLDLPKKENRFSYSHCRRRWDLCDNKELRYQFLYNWEIIMNILQDIFNFKESKEEYISTKHEDDKVIVFEKGDLLFVFNFHPVKSFEGYQIGTKWGTKHQIILDSDEERFMGKIRLKHGYNNSFPCTKKIFNNRPYNMKVYLPSRTCMVLIAEENIKKYDNISKLDIKFD